MELRQVEAYWAVMRCGSVTAAARMLHVSQPAVSKAIKRAEDRLGLRLFERIGGRMLPTAESHALFPVVDRIFREIEALKAQAGDLESMQQGVLRIGASSAIAASVMPAAVASFQAAYPRAKIVAMLLPAAELVERLHADAIDIGYALSTEGEASARATPIGTTRIACVVPDSHPLAAQKVIRPPDLAGIPLISFPQKSLFGRALEGAFRDDGVDFRLAIQVDLSLQAALFVRSLCGVALIDTLMRSVELSGLIWKPFEPALIFPIYELIPADRPLSRVAAAFRGFAAAAAHSVAC